MSTGDEITPRPQAPTRALRDLVAAGLITLAVLTMTALAFSVEWRVGVAALACMALIGGILLGLE